MPLSRSARRLVWLVAAAALACGQSFKLSNYPDSQSLWDAANREFREKNWDNAVTALERLTLDLPAADTLLPRAHYLLARAYAGRGEHLLAAQAFSRVAQEFPGDSLADDALLESARSYQRLWRKPSLDAQYGQTAIATYRSLPAAYPDSPLVREANAGIRLLEEWFAKKDYENGMHYFRRKGYDSAIIYFRDVVANYPETATSRAAQLRLVEAYREIRYREDAAEVCQALRTKYAGDREVRELCGDAPPPAVASPASGARPDSAARDTAAVRPPR